MARSVTPLWAAVVVAAALLLGFCTAQQTRRAQQRLAEVQQEVVYERARARAMRGQARLHRDVRRLLSAPGTRRAELPALREGFPPLRVYWHPELGLLFSAGGLAAREGEGYGCQIRAPGAGEGNSVMLRLLPDEQGNILFLWEPPAPLGAAPEIEVLAEAAGGAGSARQRIWAGKLEPAGRR